MPTATQHMSSPPHGTPAPAGMVHFKTSPDAASANDDLNSEPSITPQPQQQTICDPEKDKDCSSSKKHITGNLDTDKCCLMAFRPPLNSFPSF